ncbi:DEAD/DEAH box helicase family protein [uncultured Helicobacter sp.]|uniref:DEAD/DEAH box helicase family protein n=1 Tax=uncultured Helicobacter sp. TaxID=175537 RepID=UPI00374F471E
MREREQTLQEQIIKEYGKKNLRELEIPSYISENLSKELREYQIEALKLYLANNQTLKARHLMFNMATGSGKTLIMAALMLECYKRGYRDFIFFVNATSVLEKTKANFSDALSHKYLFSQSIRIDSKNVGITIIENLNESKEGCINIYFNTVQGLFSLLNNERENSLSFEDLKEKKLVFLADEAHHLNSETKKKLEKNEALDKESWESIVRKAYESHSENLLFEFSATIPQEKEVLAKYSDKIVYEYDLKKFCENGYSKRIFLIKYEDLGLESRFLGAMLLSLYRECVASKYGIFLKPVVLFKSESIKESKQNEEAFIAFVANLTSQEILRFYADIEASEDRDLLLLQSLAFFKENFGEALWQERVLQSLKAGFDTCHILNVNNDNEAVKCQIMLNKLEDRENEVRVIFAVDKLNEGWDVLNLFDIVRLGSKAKNPKTTTTKEVQLIGRGARLFPFLPQGLDSDLEYKRKFDSDLGNALSVLERLSYHTLNDVGFIAELESQMQKNGLLFENEKKKIVLNMSKRAKQITKDHTIFTISNKRLRGSQRPNLFNYERYKEIQEHISTLEIPLFSHKVAESEVDFAKKIENVANKKGVKKFCDVVAKEVFYKALNRLGLGFDTYIQPFGFESKEMFYQSFHNMEIELDKRQEFSRDNSLEIAKYILENFKKQTYEIEHNPTATDFRVQKLKLEDKKEIFSTKTFTQSAQYEWLYYDRYSTDSALEQEFLEFIERHKESIDKSFSQWVIVRNDGFSEFRIYDNRQYLESTSDDITQTKTTKSIKNPNFAQGFEPDFIFFGKRNNEEDKGLLSIECFIESKGAHLSGDEHYRGKDTWKEEFLQSLKGKEFAIAQDDCNTPKNPHNETSSNMYPRKLTIYALPFFIKRADTKFKESFEEFLAGSDEEQR